MKTVFISSTFKDMQAERDLLHKNVFPQLRKMLEKNGESIQELDLRWGVDTLDLSEEESGHKVLKVCIDAIDRSHPYIIVLLGERYGWIPDKSVVEGCHDERILSIFEENTSITNLEIKYGVLSEEETLAKCVFCFRDPHVLDEIDDEYKHIYSAESELHRQRLEQIKELIASKENVVIINYQAHWDSESKQICSLDGLCDDLLSALEKMLKDNLPKHGIQSEFDRLRSKMTLVQEHYLASYVTRYYEEAVILEGIQSFNHNASSFFEKRKNDQFEIIHIVGTPGSGKSAVMASVERYLRENGCDTILYFAMAADSSGYSGLKEFTARSLEAICGVESSGSDDPYERFGRLAPLLREREIYCFIDGLDQVFSSECGSVCFDLPFLCPDMFYIVSSTDGSFDGITGKDLHITPRIVNIDRFGLAQKREMILRASAQRGKKPDQYIVDLMMQKEGSGTPLFLSIMLQRLFMMDSREFEQADALSPGMQGLHEYMERLIREMPENTEHLVSYLFQITSERFCLKQYREALVLLSASEYGLSDSELAELFDLDGKIFQQLPFQQMVCYLYDVFTTYDDAKWNFTHRLYKECILNTVTPSERAWAEELLIEYSLSHPVFLRQEGYRYILKRGGEEIVPIILGSLDRENCGEVCEYLLKCFADDCDRYAFLRDRALNTDNYEIARFLLLTAEKYRGDRPDDFFGGLLIALSENKKLAPSEIAEIRDKTALYLYKTNDERLNEAFLLASLDNASKAWEPYREIYIASTHRLRLIIRKRNGDKDLMKEVSEELCRSLRQLEAALKSEEASQRVDLLLTGLKEYASSVIEYSRYCDYYGEGADAELMKNCLEMLTQYAQAADAESVVDTTVGVYAVLVQHYASKRYRSNALLKEYGKSALAYCEERMGSSPKPETLRNAVELYCAYARLFKPAWQFEYLKTALELSRRLYNIEPSEKNKELIAWTACMFADSGDHAVTDRQGDSRLGSWSRSDPDRYRNDGLALYEELCNDGTSSWYLFDYINSNLVYAEKRIADGDYDAAKPFIENIVRTAPDISSDKKTNELLRDAFLAAAQVKHAFSENDIALTYILKSLHFAEAADVDESLYSHYEAKALLCRCRILFALNKREELLGAVTCALNYEKRRKNRHNKDAIQRELELICLKCLTLNSLGCGEKAASLFGELPAEYKDHAENELNKRDRLRGLYTLCKGEVSFLSGDRDKANGLYRESLDVWRGVTWQAERSENENYAGFIKQEYGEKYRSAKYFEVYCRIRLAVISGSFDDVLPVFSAVSCVKSWLNPQFPKNNLKSTGAEGTRQVARLMLCGTDKYDKLRATIENMIDTVRKGVPAANDEVRINLIAGISGGTGSGTVIDVAYMIHDIMSTRGIVAYNLRGFFYLPDAQKNIPDIRNNPSTWNNLQRNGYAALKEIDYFMTNGRPDGSEPIYKLQTENKPVTSSKKIFEVGDCILVSSVTTQAAISDVNEMIERMSSFISYVFTDMSSIQAAKNVKMNPTDKAGGQDILSTLCNFSRGTLPA